MHLFLQWNADSGDALDAGPLPFFIAENDVPLCLSIIHALIDMNNKQYTFYKLYSNNTGIIRYGAVIIVRCKT